MSTTRRQRTTSITSIAGLLALFVCIFTLPEALVYLGRANAEAAAEPLTTRGVVVVIVGFGTLLVGGLLTIAGVVMRRTAAPQHNPEDDYVAEHFGETEAVHEYDPLELNPRLQNRERGRDEH